MVDSGTGQPRRAASSPSTDTCRTVSAPAASAHQVMGLLGHDLPELAVEVGDGHVGGDQGDAPVCRDAVVGDAAVPLAGVGLGHPQRGDAAAAERGGRR